MDTIFHVIGVTAPLLFSPGANNMLLMNAGATHGISRSLPHVFGSVCGFIFVLLLCYFGLSEVIEVQPNVVYIIKGLGALWLLYLAWGFYRIDHSRRQTDKEAVHIKPWSFFQAFIFMLTNPGAISLSLIVFSIAVDTSMIVMFLTVGLLGLLATLMWTVNGRLLRCLLLQPQLGGFVMKLLCVILVYSAIKLLSY